MESRFRRYQFRCSIENAIPTTAVFYSTVAPLSCAISRFGWYVSLVLECRRIVINFLNGLHIHAYVSYAKQDRSSGKYLRVATDIFRENSADGSAILRFSSWIYWLKQFTDIGLQNIYPLLVLREMFIKSCNDNRAYHHWKF